MWWDNCLERGEVPAMNRKKVKLHNRLGKKWKRTTTINDRIVNELKNIVHEKPELHLDEIADKPGNRIDAFPPFKTIWLTLHEKCECSLQVCYDISQQRDEMETQRHDATLKALVNDVMKVVIADEMHKDKNASRRLKQTGKLDHHSTFIQMILEEIE